MPPRFGRERGKLSLSLPPSHSPHSEIALSNLLAPVTRYNTLPFRFPPILLTLPFGLPLVFKNPLSRVICRGRGAAQGTCQVALFDGWGRDVPVNHCPMEPASTGSSFFHHLSGPLIHEWPQYRPNRSCDSPKWLLKKIIAFTKFSIIRLGVSEHTQHTPDPSMTYRDHA